MESFRLDQIGSVPDEPGIYAWYHELTVPLADVRSYRSAIEAAGTKDEKRKLVAEFAERFIFSVYRDTDYVVELKGPLKPRYRGAIPHVHELSGSFVDAVVDAPERLEDLVQVLRTTAPYFASPIYLGMAKSSLRQRLATHRRLLDQYRERADRRTDGSFPDADHSFAFDAMVLRRFKPTDLKVYVMPLSSAPAAAVTAEYVLNRINFPLCGRN